MISLDSSILIDYFRKTQKEKTAFYKLSGQYPHFAISIITVFEVLCGANSDQKRFWQTIFDEMTILPFDAVVNEKAVEIYQTLKSSGNLIELRDLFIAASALAHDLPLATLNVKHFERVNGLFLVEL
ncbi:MAG TPA: type II toxin-antitoxin system VapC family toxin [Haliscomenobacter sp.]|uniref:type II toxin-antitoxin system VapC family toxin n=1 Tax=Haliscomenobacter sp. TaxID=2717303 RepID=UPI002B84A618|nr:type II toxin-antitoxin system VapC family toxin [Haliscomenobacter sp.]HOY21250.1 type II toxin-antitoxin system VapC family toxin [Haliscomenobacter sp.]